MERILCAGFTLFALLLAFAASSFAYTKETDFTDNDNGTITDNITGLIWQKTSDSTKRPWQGAVDYCNSNSAGLPGSGWRLPGVEELGTISIDTSVFNAKYDYYWSASSSPRDPNRMMTVFLNTGGTYSGEKTDSHLVRCVR